MIKKYFKDWTKFELSFLIIGLSLAILFTIIFKGTIIDMCYTILYFTTALLMSKGKVECYLIRIYKCIFLWNSIIQSSLLWRIINYNIFNISNNDSRNN